jgi:exopolysaccharide biosynthesis polyprenyl glycosylphosphotransferase
MFEPRTSESRRATILLDVAATLLSFLAAYRLREVFLGEPVLLLPHVGLLPIVIPAWVGLLTWSGAYRSPVTGSLAQHAVAVARAVGAGLVGVVAFLFMLDVESVSRLVLVTFCVLSVQALIAIRAISAWRLRRLLRRGESFRRVLIVGSGTRAQHVSAAMTAQDPGVDIVGYVDPDPERVGTRVGTRSVLGTVDDITWILKDHVLDEVVVSVPRSLLSSVEKAARACEEEGITVRMPADIFGVNVARVGLDRCDGLPLLAFEPVAQGEWKLLVKRLVDLVASLAVMPVLLPLMGLVAIAIKLDSPGPVFFVQPRVGLHKRRFRLFKFRTMVVGSEGLQHQLEHLNEADGPVFKIRHDPRITRVGRVLRRTSLDELPQLFNVILGEMSLVGPRPLPLRDVNLFDTGMQRRRFSVKPGVTCLWQISGRSDLPFSRWLELDLWYIENWCLALDFKILAQTVPAVLRGSGAA